MDCLEMLLGTPVDAMLVNTGFGSPENWKETTMQIAQTNQNEMERKPCIGHERGRSSVAGMVSRTCCSIAALVAIMVGMPFSSMADDLPLVYAIENTGAGYPAPPLPTLANLPTIQPLPDPFAWANDPMNIGGTRTTNFVDWSHHRAEIKAQIENYEIGYKPPVDLTNIFASYSGSATSGTLTVRVTNIVAGVARTLTLTCAISIPAGAGPFPAIIGMNSPNGSISLGGRAIATITYLHNQVTTYGSPANSNPYYALYAAPYSPALNIDNTGQYSAWAWGVSRIIDGLYKLNGTLGTAQINLQRIGVTGCSYAGKMALFCGALDERIALTIPQESGGGGAPNWRYSYQMEPYGTVEGLAQTDHNWFSEYMFTFADANTAKLPEDHHELMAMVAPRALFATGNPDGAVWLSNPSCYVSCKAVEQVYNTFGLGDRFGYNINGGKQHCQLTADVISDVGAFLDKFLMGITTVNTITNRHVPSSYSSIDYARWTAWWGTTNPVFPYAGRLSLSMPSAATEGDGTLGGQGRLSVSETPTNDLVVNLTSSITNRITVAASVVIPAGQSNAVFDLTIIDNSILDGDQFVTITASSPVCVNGPQIRVITVHDNEKPHSIYLGIPAAATEGDGTLVGQGSLSVTPTPTDDLVVNLTSSDTSEVTVPASVVIPAGQSNAVFDLTIIDDSLLDGDQVATITASGLLCTNAPQATITVHDNETATLSVTLPASASESAGTLVNAGSVSIGTAAGANVTVSLSSSDTSRLAVPPTTVIPTGQTSAVFNLTFVNNNVIEGPKNVSVTAHVPNWTDGSASMTILDDDPMPDHFAWSAVASPQLIGEPFHVTITAQDASNNISDFRLPVSLNAFLAGASLGTNTLLNSPGAADSELDAGIEYTLGYSFTPSTNLAVTHVRHYFGDKVSIWTDGGLLLASQIVVSVPGTWVDTALSNPVLLIAGSTYRIATHETNTDYYWRSDLPKTFADGVIDGTWVDQGDVFPEQMDPFTQWYYVDLRYATDVSSVPVSPVQTPDFGGGVWSGDVSVLQPGAAVSLQASADPGSSGQSLPFAVLGTPKLAIATFSNSVVLSWPVAASGFNLEQASTLPNWSACSVTPVAAGDRYNVTNTLGADRMYFRLRKP